MGTIFRGRLSAILVVGWLLSAFARAETGELNDGAVAGCRLPGCRYTRMDSEASESEPKHVIGLKGQKPGWWRNWVLNRVNTSDMSERVIPQPRGGELDVSIALEIVGHKSSHTIPMFPQMREPGTLHVAHRTAFQAI